MVAFSIIGISLFYDIDIKIYFRVMNYLITAAGKGSRLIQKGIKPPKPLVIVRGIELLI